MILVPQIAEKWFTNARPQQMQPWWKNLVSVYLSIYLSIHPSIIHPSIYIYVCIVLEVNMYIYIFMYVLYVYTVNIYIYISYRQNPFHLSNCYDHGYRFFWGHIAFRCFVPLSLLEGALSLYSVSCTRLTKVLLQYYSGLEQFWSRLHIYIYIQINKYIYRQIYIYIHIQTYSISIYMNTLCW